MSYTINRKYTIIPDGSYKVIRNCTKCGGKSTYINTNHFRVNANGNQLDVWLIYQCEKCKHTYNLTIYERKKPSDIQQEEYHKFITNDIELAIVYGNSKELFAKNKVEIDMEHIAYHIVPIVNDCQQINTNIMIQNPYKLKLRTDRVLAEILQVTRSIIKTMGKEGKIPDLPKYVGQSTEIVIRR